VSVTAPERVEATSTKRRWRAVATSPVLVAIVGGVFVGAVVMVISGNNPFTTYAEIVEGAFFNGNLTDTLARSVPLVGMALVAAIPLRGGMVNLGGDGQLVVGGLVAAVVALELPGPGAFRLVVAVLAAVLAAGLYAALPAVAEAKVGVPLLISTLLLNYPARYLASYLVRFPLRDEASGLPETDLVPSGVRIPYLPGSSLTSGLLLIVLVLVVAVAVDRRTATGYEVRMRGANPRFAAYGGVPLGTQTVKVMFASGCIAGCVGAILSLGVLFRYTDGALLSPGYTWTGLMAALLAAGEPIGAAVAAFGFAALQVGGFGMERATQIPNELTALLQAVIIIFLAARGGLVRREGAGR
jgi:ABC-type uncharacterized transport system permease subunit